MDNRINSITSHIDEHSISTRVRQLRSEHLRTSRTPITIVLVEGEFIDPLIYQGLFDVTRCHIEPTFGKKNAVNAIAILIKSNFQGVIAIVDDDFDSINGSKIRTENIISTDTHDIENLILASPALEKYLLYLLPPDKHKFQPSFSKEVRDTIVNLCLPLGFMRWYFIVKNKPANFSTMDFRCFVDVRYRRINIQLAIRDVLAKNKDSGVQENDLENHVQENLKNNKYEWWLVCQGHDLIKILHLLLPSMLFTYAPRDQKDRDRFFDDRNPMINHENSIVKHLAMCYEKSNFESTIMYSCIVEWEKRNSPYCIMRH